MEILKRKNEFEISDSKRQKTSEEVQKSTREDVQSQGTVEDDSEDEDELIERLFGTKTIKNTELVDTEITTNVHNKSDTDVQVCASITPNKEEDEGCVWEDNADNKVMSVILLIRSITAPHVPHWIFFCMLLRVLPTRVRPVPVFGRHGTDLNFFFLPARHLEFCLNRESMQIRLNYPCFLDIHFLLYKDFQETTKTAEAKFAEISSGWLRLKKSSQEPFSGKVFTESRDHLAEKIIDIESCGELGIKSYGRQS